MNYIERALTFICQGEQLVGVLATPDDPSRSTGIGMLVVVGGPQYRVGAHRQFVQFARAVAGAGHSVLRFDARGMGDSTGARRPFEALDADIAAALSALRYEAPSVQSTVLMGLCDGAAAAWLYLDQAANHRVAALCMANPWVRSEATLAHTQVKHYYSQRVRQLDFWRKLLSGQVGADALKAIVRNIRMTYMNRHAREVAEALEPFPLRMARSCASFGGPQLIVLSESDLTAQEFAGQLKTNSLWTSAVSRPAVEVKHLAGADHTFSTSETRHKFEILVLQWLGSRLAASPR